MSFSSAHKISKKYPDIMDSKTQTHFQLLCTISRQVITMLKMGYFDDFTVKNLGL